MRNRLRRALRRGRADGQSVEIEKRQSRSRTLGTERLEPRTLLAADVVISELMASNSQTLADEDGEFSDWLELYNAGTAAADLNGWYLTDDANDLDRWRLPRITLDPGRFLIVFASSKNRANPAGQLHTNFKLRSAGEYLALVEPDGDTVAFEYAPQFPAQLPDISFGIPQEFTTETLVTSGAPATGWIPSDDALADQWLTAGFDDSAWLTGTTGIGFERGTGFEDLIGIDVEDEMWMHNGTAYLRVPFDVTDPTQMNSLVLRMKYDDGFVAYLNGTRVASMNAPDDIDWQSTADGTQSDSRAVQFEDFDITEHLAALRPGNNMLAIHGLNAGTTNSDFLIMPELVAFVEGETRVDLRHFLPKPSPGASNGVGSPALAAPADFSVPGGVFTESFALELSSATPEAVIRFTLDGSEPSERSRIYDRPITINNSSSVRARSFAPGLVSGPSVNQAYVLLDNRLLNISSDLPIVVLENFNGRRPPSQGFQPMAMSIFEQDGGRTVLTEDPTLSTRGGIRVRGSSTGNREKASYTIEAWDDNNDDKPISPLGMPAESDWVLYGAYNFDRALIRNALMYDLSNQAGRYAVRTRFVEVYFNQNGGPVSQADYMGVYSFMEKIKRDPERVDVEELTPSDIAEPDVSGGYILKIDRPDPGDSGFSAAGQTIRYVDPKEDDIELVPQQQAWIRDYFNQFGAALNGPDFNDPDVGYARYIDVDSWIDHHILNVLPMNVDAFRLSGYFHKDRGGKIVMGPIWDFDRSMESTDGRDNNPRSWNGTGDATRFFDYPWWGRLFDDPDFWQKWTDRWGQLRRTVLSTENINATIDSMADTIREAQARNFDRWSGVRPRFGGFQGEIDHLKQWLADRVEWIDGHFITQPVFDHSGGDIEPGFELGITSEHDVYYTVDGSDPRLPGGRISRDAILAQPALDTITLLPSGAASTALVPTDDSLGSAWTEIGFDDSGWTTGVSGMGYDQRDDFDELIGLDVEEEMFGVNTSAYVRVPFHVDDLSVIDSLVLKMKYDDGFVAYLNGVEVAQDNAPDELTWASAASQSRSDASAQVFQEFVISQHLPLLQAGENVLAIQGLNSFSTDSDFLILPELSTIGEPMAVVTLENSARITARAHRRGSWSAPTAATFLVEVPPELRITEIMYHPDDPVGGPFNDEDFEFIEFQNTGQTTLSLGGIHFADGIDFTFPDMNLAPGGLVVVVANQPAFQSRYGAVDNVVGQYTGRLSNSGEHLRLVGALEETILDFTYRDFWYRATDGDGRSLVIRNPRAGADTWGLAESWRASDAVGGTPGVADPESLVGDTNLDGRVDIKDLNTVRNQFGTAGSADLNRDGVVDVDDLNIVRANFGATVAPLPLNVNRPTVTHVAPAAADRVLPEMRLERTVRAARRFDLRASRGHVPAATERLAWDDALAELLEGRIVSR